MILVLCLSLARSHNTHNCCKDTKPSRNMAHEESSCMFPFGNGKRERKGVWMNVKAKKREFILENSGPQCTKASNQPYRNTCCAHGSRD